MRLFAALVALACLGTPVAAQEHDHEHGRPHSHRGPGPHFIDAFFTENAYIERKLRPDLFLASGDGSDLATFRLEVEWALLRNLSLIVHAPLHRVMPAGLEAETGIGDVSAGPKLAVINDRAAFILALGADVVFATGDEARGLGHGQGAIAPFVLAWLPFGPERRWLVQGAIHVDIPLQRDHETHAELGTAVSWTSPVGVTPIVELLAELPVDGAEPAALAVAPQFRWEFAPAWEVGAALRLPIGGPREEDYRVAVGFIRHFPLPGS